MEKRYDPTYTDYQRHEFEGVRLSRKGKKLARETAEYLGAKPSIKERLAAKAFGIIFRSGPEIAAAVTLGASRLAFNQPTRLCDQPVPPHSSRPAGFNVKKNRAV